MRPVGLVYTAILIGTASVIACSVGCGKRVDRPNSKLDTATAADLIKALRSADKYWVYARSDPHPTRGDRLIYMLQLEASGDCWCFVDGGWTGQKEPENYRLAPRTFGELRSLIIDTNLLTLESEERRTGHYTHCYVKVRVGNLTKSLGFEGDTQPRQEAARLFDYIKSAIDAPMKLKVSDEEAAPVRLQTLKALNGQ